MKRREIVKILETSECPLCKKYLSIEKKGKEFKAEHPSGLCQFMLKIKASEDMSLDDLIDTLESKICPKCGGELFEYDYKDYKMVYCANDNFSIEVSVK